jgi:glycosyltransferase involved in cell wall biosynthesis
MIKSKISFIIPTTNSGGIENYLLRYLRFCEEVSNITIIIRSHQKGELYDAYASLGVNLIFMPVGYLNPMSLWKHYKFYKAQKFDIICDFNANFAGLVMWVAKQASVSKRIAFYRQSSHHFKLSKARLAYTNFLNRLVYYHSTSIFSNSLEAFNFFFSGRYENDNRFHVIKNGINLTDYELSNSKGALRNELGLPLDKYIIGHTGRFAEAKNHFFLLEVIRILAKNYTDILFVLIGEETEKLIPKIKELQIEQYVQVLGYQREIPSYLKSFDAYFFPSVTEGQPNALIEAMVAGLPIACSNIKAISECLPRNSEHCRFNPTNVKEAVEVVKNLRETPQRFIFKDFAKANFNALIQFKEFQIKLKYQ